MIEVASAIIVPVLLEQVLELFKRGKDYPEFHTITLAMFDLTGSSGLKIDKGHKKGVSVALEHNAICEKIASDYSGKVLKYMGDGLFVQFDNPKSACEAAIKIKQEVCNQKKYQTKGGITMGMVQNIEIGGITDTLGAIVDKCAGLCSLAFPDQILIDSVTYGASYSVLKDIDDIIISDASIKKMKGIGKENVYEISTNSLGLIGFDFLPLNVIEDGRMPLHEKMEYLSKASEEIIELGIGLTTFSDNYYKQRSPECKDIIKKLIKDGVKIKCYIINDKNPLLKSYLELNDNLTYLDRMKMAKIKLLDIKNELDEINKDGFKIFQYDHLPTFHASCIDINTEKGKISISNYLPFTLRSENPVIQFSNELNPIIFSKYQKSINKIIENSKELI